MKRALCMAAVAVALAGACGDDSSSFDAGGAAIDGAVVSDSLPQPDADPALFPDPGPLVGTIGVYERSGPLTDGCGPGGTRGDVLGQVTGSPMTDFHVEAMNDGTCRLRTYAVGNCDNCINGFCVAPDECRPFSPGASAGAMTLTGTKSALTMSEIFTGTYRPDEYPIPGDLFDDGDPITIATAGDTVPAFSIQTAGVAPLDITFTDDEITLVDGQDYTFNWTPAGGNADRIRVTINATGIGHGTPRVAILECDGPDTGSLTIPSAFVDAFPDIMAEELCFGYDCACSSITRYTRGAVDSIADADVELIVGSQVDFLVNHNAP